MNQSTETARKYQAQTPIHSTNDAEIPVEFDSHLSIGLAPDDIQRRINEISWQFTGAGWKNLPQELVDEIINYLLDDLDALTACSLTCKRLFGATRHFIHQWLACSDSRPDHTKSKESLLGRRKRGPGAFDQLIDADRAGVLHFTQHLTFKAEDGSLNPRNLEKYLPYLRSITKLHTLTLNTFHANPFIPVFDDHFGMFTNALRHLDIRNAYGTERQLSYIVCQFPLLEDLTIAFPAGERTAHRGHHVPAITQSPPLRGKLVVAQVHSRKLFGGLAAIPDGLSFRSLELHRCKHLEVILAACGHVATSVSYLWFWGDLDTIALDLKQSEVLERFEFTAQLSSLCQVHQWLHQTLQTITSAAFKEFVVWILNTVHPWSLRQPMSVDGWRAVDALLSILGERNPKFRVVFKGDLDSFRCGTRGEHDTIRWLIESHLPLVSSKGLVKFEQVRHVENRFRKSCIL